MNADFLTGNLFTAIQNFWVEISLAEIFDILVVAFLVYASLALLKRTRSYLIFNGMIFLFIIYLLAGFFGLYLTTLIFRFFFSFFIVILAVIFQKELRSFFEWISLSTRTRFRNFLGKKTAAASETVSDIIIKAASYFAHHKIGSLIVLRGKQPLGGVIDSGYDLNGVLSLPLLLSIFDPSSAGHDGAVVIEKDYVKKFGAHLPLAKRFMKFGDLGTRHRAGLGLSEETDSLVIITSEERGTISVAKNGDLRVLSGAAELKKEMDEFFKGTLPQERKSIYRWFYTDIRGKLIALGIAMLLWFIFIPRSGVTTRQYNVPIEFRSLNQEMKIDFLEPKEIRVTMSGKTQDFDLLNAGSLKVKIDASSYQEGWNTATISEKDMSKPNAFLVNSLEPNSIRFHIGIIPSN